MEKKYPLDQTFRELKIFEDIYETKGKTEYIGLIYLI